MDAASGNGQNGQVETDHAGVRVPPPLIYLSGLALGAALERVAATPQPPRHLRIAAGVVGGVAAVLLDGGAARRFIASKTAMEPWRPSSALVTSGPYQYTRNPMYVGMASLYAGAALALGHLWSLAALPPIIAVIDRMVIVREERYLERRFGASYREYRTRVRRWL